MLVLQYNTHNQTNIIQTMTLNVHCNGEIIIPFLTVCRGGERKENRINFYPQTITNTTLPQLSLHPSLPPLFSLRADAVQIKLLTSDEPPYQAEHNNIALYSEENKTSNEDNTMYVQDITLSGGKKQQRPYRP